MWCLHPSLIPRAHEEHCEMQTLSVYQIAQEYGYMEVLVLLYPRGPQVLVCLETLDFTV